MWQLDLTEEEFFTLRAEQNLLVDFAYFPYKLIELLQRCISSASEQPPSFSAQLNCGTDSSAQLSFLETTSFRQVTQLSLKLKAVNDEVMKRQFSDLLRQYREQIAVLQAQLTPLTPQSSTKASTSNNNNIPHKATTTKLPTGMNSLVREKDEACAHLNQLYEVTKEAKGRTEEENAELRRENETIKARFEESQQEVIKANEIIAKLQDEMRTLKAKLKSATAIADDQMTAADSLRASNKRLQQDYNELAESAHAAKIAAESLERDNKALRGQIENLERQIQQRDAIIAHHQRQANAKDLDRAMRALDTSNPLETTATTAPVPDFTFDSTTNGDSNGYVGSKIFTDTTF